MASSSNRGDDTRRMDDLCDRFEDALRRGERPSLDDWLREARSLAEMALPELAAVELEHRLQRGEPATAAEYFSRYSVLEEDPAAVRLVAAEFRAARVGDPSVNEALFRRRYPNLALRPEWSNGPWVEAGHSTVTVAQDQPYQPSGSNPARFPYSLLSPPGATGEIGRLGAYRILGVRAEGGMGVVLQAEEIALGRPVALKLMKPTDNRNARVRFEQEARAAAAVEHPRIVIIYS